MVEVGLSALANQVGAVNDRITGLAVFKRRLFVHVTGSVCTSRFSPND